MLDNTLEFLVMSGMELPLAVMIMIPEPWANNNIMSQKKKDFYQYYATMMEPWDGPASILFSDGDMMGAVLDRNGLRPSRYYITDDDYLILSSEVGVLDIDPTKIVVKERLRPGKMLLVDTVNGRVIDDDELKETYANKQPYGEWLDRNLVKLEGSKDPERAMCRSYTKEETRSACRRHSVIPTRILRDGDPADGKKRRQRVHPPWVLTHRSPCFPSKHQPLFNYFKQLFAQVTNPPIDAIREEIVTSTTVYIGEDGNLLGGTGGELQGAEGQQPDPDQHRPDEDQRHEGRRLQGRGDSRLPTIRTPAWRRRIERLFVEVGPCTPRRSQHPDPDRPRHR